MQLSVVNQTIGEGKGDFPRLHPSACQQAPSCQESRLHSPLSHFSQPSSASCAPPGPDTITFQPAVSAPAATTNSISVFSFLATPHSPQARQDVVNTTTCHVTLPNPEAPPTSTLGHSTAFSALQKNTRAPHEQATTIEAANFSSTTNGMSVFSHIDTKDGLMGHAE